MENIVIMQKCEMDLSLICSSHVSESKLFTHLNSPIVCIIDQFFLVCHRQLFEDADLHEEKMRIMQSLGSTQKEDLIQRTLQFAMSVS